MRSLYVALAVAITLAAPHAVAAEGRVLLYDRLFADGFVANEQAYMVFSVPAGSQDVAFELDCNLHVGTLTLQAISTEGTIGPVYSMVCDGIFERVLLTAELPVSYYYGAASFTGVNGVTFRVTASA